MTSLTNKLLNENPGAAPIAAPDAAPDVDPAVAWREAAIQTASQLKPGPGQSLVTVILTKGKPRLMQGYTSGRRAVEALVNKIYGGDAWVSYWIADRFSVELKDGKLFVLFNGEVGGYIAPVNIP